MAGCAHAPSVLGHIVFAQEPDHDTAQKALDELIARRKAKLDHHHEAPPAPCPHVHGPTATERALDHAMSVVAPHDQPMHQRLRPYRGQDT